MEGVSFWEKHLESTHLWEEGEVRGACHGSWTEAFKRRVTACLGLAAALPSSATPSRVPLIVQQGQPSSTMAMLLCWSKTYSSESSQQARGPSDPCTQPLSAGAMKGKGPDAQETMCVTEVEAVGLS
jgi:hypothetical protein